MIASIRLFIRTSPGFLFALQVHHIDGRNLERLIHLLYILLASFSACTCLFTLRWVLGFCWDGPRLIMAAGESPDVSQTLHEEWIQNSLSRDTRMAGGLVERMLPSMLSEDQSRLMAILSWETWPGHNQMCLYWPLSQQFNSGALHQTLFVNTNPVRNTSSDKIQSERWTWTNDNHW